MAPHHLLSPARCSQHQNPVSLLWALLIWSYPKAAEMLLQLRNDLQLPLGILQNLLLDNKTYFFFSSLRKESQANSQYFVMGQGSPHPTGGVSCLSTFSIPSHQGENQRENQAKGQVPCSPARAGLEWLNRNSFPSKEGARTGHNKTRTRKKSDLPENGAMCGLFLTSHLKLWTVCYFGSQLFMFKK